MCDAVPSPNPAGHTWLHTPHWGSEGPHLFLIEDISVSVAGHIWVSISSQPHKVDI